MCSSSINLCVNYLGGKGEMDHTVVFKLVILQWTCFSVTSGIISNMAHLGHAQNLIIKKKVTWDQRYRAHSSKSANGFILCSLMVNFILLSK